MNPPASGFDGLWHGVAALVVLASLLLSLGRAFRARSPIDRILAAQLIGTAGVGTLLLLGHALERSRMPLPGYLDVAVVLAILAGVTGIAFVERGWQTGDEPGGGHHGSNEPASTLRERPDSDATERQPHEAPPDEAGRPEHRWHSDEGGSGR